MPLFAFALDKFWKSKFAFVECKFLPASSNHYQTVTDMVRDSIQQRVHMVKCGYNIQTFYLWLPFVTQILDAAMRVVIGRFDTEGTQYGSLWPLQNTTITTTITIMTTLWPAELKTGRNVPCKNTDRITTRTCLCSYLMLTSSAKV